MKTFRQDGNVLLLTAPSGGVVSGAPLLVGALLVIPIETVAEGLPFTAATVGCHELPKATGQAWAEGAAVYWNDTAKNVTTTASGNTKIGCAIAAAVSGATLGTVRLNGVV